MMRIVLIGMSGWVVAALTAITITLPRTLRRRGKTVALAPEAGKSLSFLQRLWPHYLLGYLIGGLSVVHAVVSFEVAGEVNAFGVFLAGCGLFLLFGQVMLGRDLRRPDARNRPALRGMHRGLMVTLVVLGLGHILLDSSILSILHALAR